MNDMTKIYSTDDVETVEIRVFLGDLWRGFVKFWWIAALLATLLGGWQFYQNYVRYTPVYTVTGTYTVHTENATLTGESGISAYSFYYDRNTADLLASSFPVVLSSNIVRQKVCSELGLPYMPASVSASCVSGSNLVTLTAQGLDPELTYNTLIAITKHYTAVADYIMGRTRLVTIVEPVMPAAPSNAVVWKSAVLKHVLLGLFLGFDWILIYAIFRRTIRTKDDIRKKLNQQCLGILPQVTFKRYRQKIATDVLVTNPRVGNEFLEAVRLLRSAVQTAMGEHGKVLMITSTAPGEGKTVTVINLAAMLARNTHRVLVLDCDLRKSGIRALLPVEEAPVTFQNEVYEIRHMEALGIDLLCFHTNHRNPRRILRAEFLEEQLRELKSQYDYLLMDTPPCGIIADAAYVATVADGVLYVVRQDAVMQSSILGGLNNLLAADANLLGCVLNGTAGGLGGYGYGYSYGGYSHYYRRGYGYGYGKK